MKTYVFEPWTTEDSREAILERLVTETIRRRYKHILAGVERREREMLSKLTDEEIMKLSKDIIWLQGVEDMHAFIQEFIDWKNDPEKQLLYKLRKNMAEKMSEPRWTR